jgi:hypothetical protein
MSISEVNSAASPVRRIVMSSVTTSVVALSMAVPLIQRRLAPSLGLERSLLVGTAILLACGILAVMCWPPPFEAAPPRLEHVALVGGCLVAAVVVYANARTLLPVMFAGPPDVYKGDMLVITEAGVRQVLAGKTPYTMYHVPWEMTLSYGPMLWGPFVMPVVLHADVRLLTLICFSFVTTGLVVSAAYAATARRWVNAVAGVLLALAFAFQPDVNAFYAIGHTFVYWPLLLVFCLLISIDRWMAAAAVLGLLVCARSTMVSLVPVFLMTAHFQHRLNWRLAGVLALFTIGPFLPFVFADPRSIVFSMYGAYQKTIKGFVWVSTHWVQQTFGVTGPLLTRGLQRYIEAVQVVSLLVVYALAWRSLRRGRRPEPWLALSLLVFSMTTLWPVIYLYFDVWVLLLAGSAVSAFAIPRRALQLTASVAVMAAVSTAAILAAGSSLRGRYDIDVGTPDASPMTGAGFGTDQAVVDGSRNFVWVEGPTARVRAPRASLMPATIVVELQPFGDRPQLMRVSVNGKTVGEAPLRAGWQAVSFRAPARLWNYGFNVLTLDFLRTAPDPATGRQLSAGIDRISIH